MVKKDFDILLATKIFKKLDLYLYFSQKWVYMNETKYMSFLIKDVELFGKKLKIVSTKILIVNLYIMKNIKKLNLSLEMEESTQISTIIKYQKKVLNLFVYQ